MGLPDDEVQKILSSSTTDRIPELSGHLQVASESAATHCLQAAARRVSCQQYKTKKLCRSLTGWTLHGATTLSDRTH
jgi:hypothetical protein